MSKAIPGDTDDMELDQLAETELQRLQKQVCYVKYFL